MDGGVTYDWNQSSYVQMLFIVVNTHVTPLCIDMRNVNIYLTSSL